MTMKKELTLKHGVFIAAAVLLIAGIAFAGAAAAEEPQTLVWSSSNVDTALSNGGYYDVVVSGSSLNGVGAKTVKNDTIIDFNYRNLAIGTPALGSQSAAMISQLQIKPGKVVTIKNLVIDGGSISSNGIVGVISGFIKSTENVGTENVGICFVENVTIKNVSLNAPSSGSLNYMGLVFGATNGVALKMTNVTVDGCSLTSSIGITGGFIGNLVQYNALVVENSTLRNTYITGGSGTAAYSSTSPYLGVGGIYGSDAWQHCNLSIAIINTSVENCIIKGVHSYNNVGFLGGQASETGIKISNSAFFNYGCSVIGASNYSCVKVVGCKVTNSVSESAGRFSGGLFGYIGASASSSGYCTVTDNEILSCTIVNTNNDGYSGGLSGRIKTTVNPSISNNTISNSCIVASGSSGIAAGFSPVGM